MTLDLYDEFAYGPDDAWLRDEGYQDAFDETYPNTFDDAFDETYPNTFDDAFDEANPDTFDDAQGDALGPTRALRQTLRGDLAAASEEDLELALSRMQESMSPAEAFNFGQALSQIGRSVGQVFSDPTVSAIARTALPIAGAALGTVVGGPVGTALGGQLGTLAAGALPPPPGARPRAGPAVPARAGALVLPAVMSPVAAPSPQVPAPSAGLVAPAPAVLGGSTAAAQGLVLTQQPQVLQSLLATALGQHGQGQVAGVPNAQLLGMLSQVFGRAAADADELMYLGRGDQDGADGEELEEFSGDAQDLYEALVDADNLELAEALDSAELLL